jgi:hypothetical protein
MRTTTAGSIVAHCDQKRNTNTMPQLDSGAPSMGMATANPAATHIDRQRNPLTEPELADTNCP